MNVAPQYRRKKFILAVVLTIVATLCIIHRTDQTLTGAETSHVFGHSVTGSE